MFSKAYSAVINGINGLIVSVEADVKTGFPYLIWWDCLTLKSRRPRKVR